MKRIGVMSTAVLSLALGVAAPVFAQQEQRDQQDEQKGKPAQQEQKKAQPEKRAQQEEKNARPQDKNTKQEEKSAQQQGRAQQAKPEPQAQRASGNRGGRIPDDRFKANFGREHTFHVSEGDYRNHRFQYGGYWFGFVDPWPSNWLYTQDVFVVEIDGVYYLCNPMYPGVNIALSFTL